MLQINTLKNTVFGPHAWNFNPPLKQTVEVRTAAADREKWKSSVKALCATRHEVDR